MTAPFWLNTPEMQAYTQEYYTKYKVYPGELSMDYYLSTLSLCEGIKKAGTTDTDQVIRTLETLTMTNTPLGVISYNDYDHQANSPLWYGSSIISPDYPIAIAQNMIKYQDNIYPTRDEVLALRSGH